MNQIILIGRLTIDPILRFTPGSGKAVARFNIAVNREYSKDKEADFFKIVVWGKNAENVANYVKKGRLVAVNGSLRNNNYEDKNGVKHYNNEVVANRVEFLDYERSTQEKNQSRNDQQYTGNYNGFQPIDTDDDIPF